MRNLRFVGPVSFSKGLLKWSFSGNKASHALDGTATACGSITVLRQWMKEESNHKNLTFQSGDADVFADNTQ